MMDGNCSECDKCNRALLMVQPMISYRIRFGRFGQKVTKLDTATRMGTIKISLRNREDTKVREKVELVGLKGRSIRARPRWRSEVYGSG